MIHYITTDDLGRILNAGSSGGEMTEEILRTHIPDVIVIQEPVTDLSSHYWDGEQVVAMPKKPSNHHSFDFSKKQWVADVELAWSKVRSTRDDLLTKSDWTQLPDVPEHCAELWKDYRQNLRHITTQQDAWNITWPVAPK